MTRPVCSNCIVDSVLKAWVEENGEDATCTYCEQEGICCELEAVARHIDPVLRQFYGVAPEEGHVTPYSDNVQYYSEGPTAEDIIAQLVDLENIAKDIVAILSDDEAFDVHDGANALYDGTPLQHIDAYPGDFLDIWDTFQQRLKHEVRFFDDQGRRMLDTLFGDLAEFGGGRAIVELLPNDKEARLFRARIVENESDAEDFVRNPARHIGPPPPGRARAGRMNPAGVAAFYGAFAPGVALAEIRPPVGSLVAVGEFSLLKPLRLLDMSFLPFAYHDESMFSSRYDEARSKVRFLEVFHRRISRPVLPSDESLAYLPTQAVAAYVTNVMGLDGIIYSSTQIGAEGESAGEQLPRNLCNVALFGSAAVVERTPPPPRPPEPETEEDFAAFPILTGLSQRKVAPDPIAPEAPPVSSRTAEGPVDLPAGAEQALPGKAVVPDHDGLGENGKAAALRVKRDPQLVRIHAVRVETSPIFAHLYDSGQIIIDDFEEHDGY